jgi:predicted DNA-binding transcriptional regulator YafY
MCIRDSQHSVGIMKNEGKPSKVVLELKDPYNKLIQLEPIHTSQKIIKSKNDTMQIELSVYTNQELYNRILSMSSYCKVIQPAALKKIISEHLVAAAEQYK